MSEVLQIENFSTFHLFIYGFEMKEIIENNTKILCQGKRGKVFWVCGMEETVSSIGMNT